MKKKEEKKPLCSNFAYYSTSVVVHFIEIEKINVKISTEIQLTW